MQCPPNTLLYCVTKSGLCALLSGMALRPVLAPSERQTSPSGYRTTRESPWALLERPTTCRT
eukprot:scaffold1439_cov404-Prasinococcus_capsulatus_cf.AAC.27